MILFHVFEKIEPLLSGYPIDLPKWEPMYITLPNDKMMVIREALYQLVGITDGDCRISLYCMAKATKIR